MSDYEVVIVGAGPAALGAGLHLRRHRRRTLVLDPESLGGALSNTDWIEDYPGFAEGISGPHLATAMVNQAKESGLEFKQAEVNKIELFSNCRWVGCADDSGFTADAVIVATGLRRKKLGVPGEATLFGRGVIDCAMCDGGLFRDRIVAVVGSGSWAVAEALYLTKLAARVLLLAEGPVLEATTVLQERVAANPKLEVLCEVQPEAIVGETQVEAVELRRVRDGERCTVRVDGVLASVGGTPAIDFLDGMVTLDGSGHVIVDSGMQTEVPYVFAVGDIRRGSPRTIASAVGDGAMAASECVKLLSAGQG